MEHNERFEHEETSNLDILVGGQWGSEGKGEIAAAMARDRFYDLSVRVGGPNAGHTYHLGPNSDTKVVMRSLPVATAMNPGHTIGIIGAGAAFIPSLLMQEVSDTAERTSISPTVYIDRNAALISADHQAHEDQLVANISSTGEGVGAATADKVMRNPEIVASYPANRLYLEELAGRHGCDKVHFDQNTPDTINRSLASGLNVMLEGTQGWALGLHTSGFYPFTTSREATPWALLSQTGTNLRLADKYRIILTIRTFPIRVGGPSGPLPHEVSWEELKESTKGYIKEPEITTVTKRARRIGALDMELLHQAIQICGPTGMAITFMDYVFPEAANAHPSLWPTSMYGYLRDLQKKLGVPIEYIANGPGSVWSVKQHLELHQSLWQREN